jgi:hypothetical protein
MKRKLSEAELDLHGARPNLKQAEPNRHPGEKAGI